MCEQSEGNNQGFSMTWGWANEGQELYDIQVLKNIQYRHVDITLANHKS
jgi:hypothetical protein